MGELTSTVRLPFVIDGSRATSKVKRDIHAPRGIFSIPVLDDEMATRLTRPGAVLDDVPVQEIVNFLNRAGRLWRDREYPRRRLFQQWLVAAGVPTKTADVEADWIGVFLSAQWRLDDLLEFELGSRFLLDEWVRRGETLLRALPLGRIVHILAGNAPLAGVGSIIRALITKNHSVVKASAGDLSTPIAVALSFLDIDASHPVAHALDVVYWPADDPLGSDLVASSDGVVVWGGADAVRWAHQHATPGTPLVTFGPKHSLAVVGQDADLREAGRRLAHDVAVYDQAACFSPRRVFVEGDVDAFVAELTAALEAYRQTLPKCDASDDVAAGVALQRLESTYLDHHVMAPDDAEWTVIACGPDEVHDHPLSRTVFVHPVDDLADVLGYLDRQVQTLAVYPWDGQEVLREPAARLGVPRLVELGASNFFRAGAGHDGIHSIARLVRLCSVEAPSTVHVKGTGVAFNQTLFLEKGRIVEYL